MADLVSSQVLQKTLDELRNITRIDLCVTNTDGVLLVTTFPETAIDAESIRSFVLSAADSQIVQEYHYFKVYDNQNVEYILISKGSSDDAYMIGKVAVCEIQNLIIAYKERLDKNNFIQNLLLDNLLLVDVYNRAKKLRIDTDVRRVVYMVETKLEKDISAQETVKSLFASRPRDFITAVDEKSIIIVKELEENEGYEEMDKLAQTILDTLGLDRVTQYPSNAIFDVDGDERSSMSNSITINKAYDVKLSKVTEEPVTISLKADADSIVESLNELVAGYNNLISVTNDENNNHFQGTEKLQNEIASIARSYKKQLADSGLSLNKDGTISADKEVIINADNKDALSHIYESLNSFKNSIKEKAENIALNPMDYVNNKIIAYKNPLRSFPDPYNLSAYTGMMFNGYI